ncbi:hypothetical protein CFOL_v3_09602, partial [Cephalotus follicularis]
PHLGIVGIRHRIGYIDPSAAQNTELLPRGKRRRLGGRRARVRRGHTDGHAATGWRGGDGWGSRRGTQWGGGELGEVGVLLLPGSGECSGWSWVRLRGKLLLLLLLW